MKLVEEHGLLNDADELQLLKSKHENRQKRIEQLNDELLSNLMDGATLGDANIPGAEANDDNA